MHNNDMKNFYISSLTSRQAAQEFKAIANAAEPFELRLQKDLSLFERSEIINLVNSFESTNPESIRGYLCSIRNYQIACRTLPPSVIKPINKGEIDIASAIHKKFYTSFGEVLSEIEKGCPIDEGFSEPAALALAWLGVPFKEAVQLKSEQIDLLNGILRRESKPLMYFRGDEPAALRVLRLYRNTAKAYRIKNTAYEVFEPKNNPYFLRALVSKGAKEKAAVPLRVSSFTHNFQMMSRRAKEKGFDCQFVYADIMRSGELRRIYRLEKSGTDVCSRLNMPQVLSLINSRTSFCDITYQYKQYKLAFNL